MRAAQNQANSAQEGASATAAGYGSDASNINSVLTPFLEREMNNPGGISQQDQTAMLSASQGGAGGVAGGLETRAGETEGATGNESGFGSSLDDIARQREHAASQGAEGIAAENSGVKREQQQEGASGLAGMYGKDVSGQLGALGVQTGDINASVNAGSHGWLQNLTNVIASVKGGSQIPGMALGAGGSGYGGLQDAQLMSADGSAGFMPDDDLAQGAMV